MHENRHPAGDTGKRQYQYLKRLYHYPVKYDRLMPSSNIGFHSENRPGIYTGRGTQSPENSSNGSHRHGNRKAHGNQPMAHRAELYRVDLDNRKPYIMERHKPGGADIERAELG